MKAMEQEQNQQQILTSPLPVLPRLDRLDRLLELLEEKHSMSRRHSSKTSVVGEGEELEKDQCKTLSSALQEVHHKGTLMDRLATLENRVLQLTLEMDEGKTSRSSSSTVQVLKNLGHDSGVPKVSRQDEDEKVTSNEEMIVPPLIQVETPVENCSIKSTSKANGRRKKRNGYTKWIGWVPILRC